jgi:GTP 3',8-cyclase
LVSHAFIGLGIRKIRLTGGEPLVRQNVMSLVRALGALVKSGELDELTLTTNGTQLARHAEDLAAAGIRRINVSLDTLDPSKFAAITRRHRLGNVLDGLTAAQGAGLKIKINTVVQRGVNGDEIDRLIGWCGDQRFDLTLIEAMPLGCNEAGRNPLPLSEVKSALEKRWRLLPLTDRTGGPARYVRVAETAGRLGFITPLSNHFCDGCNRVRVNCRGELRLCLGDTASVDLRPALALPSPQEAVARTIRAAVKAKPEAHAFNAGPVLDDWKQLPMHAIGG